MFVGCSPGGATAPHERKQQMSVADGPAPSPVRQLRLVVEAEGYHPALRFFRDALGLPEQAAFAGEGDAQLVILDGARATLEIANPAHKRRGDAAEVRR